MEQGICTRVYVETVCDRCYNKKVLQITKLIQAGESIIEEHTK